MKSGSRVLSPDWWCRNILTGATIFLALVQGLLGQAVELNPARAERQVVIETDLGRMVLELFPEAALRHVEAFQKRVRSEFYDGTTFHRAVPYAIIQGGDPLTHDPDHFEKYGSGGLFELEREENDLSHTRGAVSAVLVPGDPNSAGSQFFICVTDQVQLDGEYTVFGRVVEGMAVAEEISQIETDESQRLLKRVEISEMFERERPPPPKPPFSEVSLKELSRYEARIETGFGDIRVRLFPEETPETVRQFLRFAELGLYDETTFHRVVPGFVIQGGSFSSRSEPIPPELQKWVKTIPFEASARAHTRGVLALARGERADSGLDSFFIVLEDQPNLDGRYAIFGEVMEGMETVEKIASVPAEEEAPIEPIQILAIEPLKAE